MNSKNPRSYTIGSMMVMLLLVGCGTPEPVPTSSPVPPTPVPTTAPTAALAKDGEEWDYVAIGDNDTWGFFKEYAAYLEADLGAKVTIHDWHMGGQTSVSLLTKLRKNQALRQALSEAEVVTFTAKPVDRIGYQCMNEDMAGLDCSPEALAAFEEDNKAIIAEIMSLRTGSETIIRTMDLYMPFYDLWREKGIYDECWSCWEAVNESIHRVAAEHGIPIAPVYDAFNGPGHDEDPQDMVGYVFTEDPFMGNIDEKGRTVIAGLFRELGYEPMVP